MLYINKKNRIIVEIGTKNRVLKQYHKLHISGTIFNHFSHVLNL